MNEYLKLIVEVLGFFMICGFMLFLWIIT